jgi:predicted transcriptional regulator
MDVLWSVGTPTSANEIRDRVTADRDDGTAPAITTVLTVLSRLEHKGFVARTREGRPHLYSAALSRESHVADLMHEVLESSSDRSAALAHFVGTVDESEAEMLRRLLADRIQ